MHRLYVEHREYLQPHNQERAGVASFVVRGKAYFGGQGRRKLIPLTCLVVGGAVRPATYNYVYETIGSTPLTNCIGQPNTYFDFVDIFEPGNSKRDVSELGMLGTRNYDSHFSHF